MQRVFFSVLICFCKKYFAFCPDLSSVVFSSPFYVRIDEEADSGDDAVCVSYDLTGGDVLVSH